MVSENRNKFLDAGDSDDDAGRDNDSEDELQKGGRSAKRRRVVDDDRSDNDGDSGAEDASDAEDNESDDGGAQLDDSVTKSTTDQAKQDKKNNKKKKQPDEDDQEEAIFPGVSKPLSRKNLVASEEAIRKSGVVYLSRVPPFLKPAKLRSLLEPYGKINRLFLAPEDPASHSRRVKSGGNKKRSYTEGWVEFTRKADAKKACELLNARTIGGKKGTYYRDDIWNLLYLKGFKWSDLTEQISAENAERSSRMRAEISKTTKENKLFVQNLERAKMLDGMHAKTAAKKERKEAAAAAAGVGGDGSSGGDEEAGGAASAPAATGDEKPAVRERTRTFKQIPLAKKRKIGEEQPEQVKRVLSSIF
ncbi:hypothetical protein B0T17DRAFT_494433 [Bombardia bombarda]|uniref:18S rRNA factor 2 n=1 Tax=Bombardia bombarda TaxID=252184 RepID=A0AA39WU84_9PEZI|nr:hypothetical protein B0T17DRAFT_494433 [Bombardia bombarda]